MSRRTRSRTGMFAAVVLIASCAWMAGPAQAGVAGADAARSGHRLRLAVPAYWSAADPGGTAMFDQLVDAVPTVDLVVINGPHSAAPAPFDPSTAATIERLHGEGATVLAYVDSGYLGVTGNTTTRVSPGSTAMADWVTQIGRDVDDWYRLYGAAGLDGVFVDQTLPACGPDREYLRAYRTALRGLHVRHPEAMVAMNPGMSADECYTEVADAMVIFENTYAAYLDWTPPAWVSNYPATQFWHLVYGVSTLDTAAETLRLAQQRHAGYVYVTDHSPTTVTSPWNGLATYWDAEVNLVARTGRRG